MPDRPHDRAPLPDQFDGVLAEQFWAEVPDRAVATILRQLTSPIGPHERWLIRGGALGGALHAVIWLADHDMIRAPAHPDVGGTT